MFTYLITPPSAPVGNPAVNKYLRQGRRDITVTVDWVLKINYLSPPRKGRGVQTCQNYTSNCSVPWVECMYLVFTRMPGEKGVPKLQALVYDFWRKVPESNARSVGELR